MAFNQGELNFDSTSNSEGYDHWQKELQAQQHQWELKWGIILGKKSESIGENTPSLSKVS